MIAKGLAILLVVALVPLVWPWMKHYGASPVAGYVVGVLLFLLILFVARRL
ncbi:hypothetical protein [Hoeflea olei]|uniref:hypothetical protein n=1 Tax=Hoeflea olei TaxID=1480615 RepID=UPI001495A5F3|nr:hypothetical protein [Hoeflea olei]